MTTPHDPRANGENAKRRVTRIIYECGICSCYHPWAFNGDCRDDAHRYNSPEEYARRHAIGVGSLSIRSMSDRVRADGYDVPQSDDE